MGSLVISALHILALWALAVVQPVFELLGQNPEFFTVRRAVPGLVVAFVFAVSFGLPLAVVGVGAVLRRLSRPTGSFFIAATISVLVFVLTLGAMKDASFSDSIKYLLSVAIAIGAGSAYSKFETARTYLSFLTPAIIAVPVMFAAHAPIRRLLRLSVTETAVVSQSRKADVPVVMIVFDELPLASLTNADGAIDEVNFPNFSRLAGQSHWFRRTAAVGAETTSAVPAILSGKLPEPGLLPTYGDHPFNIFSLLAPSMELRALEPVTQLCLPEICGSVVKTPFVQRLTGLAADVGVIFLNRVLPTRTLALFDVPTTNLSWGNFLGDAAPVRLPDDNLVHGDLTGLPPKELVEHFVSLIRKEKSSKEPFLFMHVLLPHPPWRYFPGGVEYQSPDLVSINGLGNDDTWTGDLHRVDLSYVRHLLQLKYTDSVLGRVVSELEAAGLYDRALLVVTADHGGSFRAGMKRRELEPGNAADIVPIPLFVKRPGQRHGMIDDRTAQSVDIVPTIAAELGFSIPWETAGVSLFTPAVPERRSLRFLTIADSVSVIEPSVLDDPSGRKYKQEVLNRLQHSSAAWCGADCALGAIASASRGEELPCGAQIERQGDFLRTAGAAPLPAVVKGVITCRYDEFLPSQAAMFLNGAPFAVSEIRRDALGHASFEAFVPESFFRDGPNALELFGLSGDKPELRRIGLQDRPVMTLNESEDEGQPSFLARGAERLTVDSSAIMGSVDILRVGTRSLFVAGWAADRRLNRPPDTVAVFVNGASIFEGTAMGERSDVFNATNEPALKHSGFIYEIPFQPGDQSRLSIRIFAVFNGVGAAEIPAPSSKNFIAPRGVTLDIGRHTAAIEEKGKDSAITVGGGRRVPIVPGAVQAYLDLAMADSGGVRFEGWAVDSIAGPARSVAVFVDGVFVYEGPTGRSRADVAAGRKDPSLSNCGFLFNLPPSAVREGAKVRLFAIGGRNSATEVHYPENFPWPNEKR